MTVMKVPVTKGKGFIEINTDDVADGGDLTAEVYAEALLQGLKVLLNRGASKITKETYPDAEEMKVAAMAKANEQLAAMRSGKIKKTGAKATKVAGVVMTEARRLARNVIKDEIKRAGLKVSHYEASDITKAANALLETDQGPSIIKAAEEEIAKRAEVKVGIDVTAIQPSEKKVAKAAKEKAERATQASAAKAGKVAVRAKPKAAGPQATAH